MSQPIIKQIHEIMETAKSRGVSQLYTEDKFLNGRYIQIEGRRLINFGNCSYLGLELDPRIKEAGIRAIEKFGIQYSSSRSYVSIGLYRTLETKLYRLFNTENVQVTPTTTLGHYGILPVLIQSGDLLILDQQVHASVQDASRKLPMQGVELTVIRHNSLAQLERMIIRSQKTKKKIWYACDGVYSMYGDVAPMEELILLLDKYDQFYLYVDDAHGMSWTGENGKGQVLGKHEIHPKIVTAVSFAKAFGCGGAAFIFPNKTISEQVRNCAGPMIFSGPIQNPVLGALIASTDIHLSDEIHSLQSNLMFKVTYCYNLLVKAGLPIVSSCDTPIFFIGMLF